MTPHCLVTSFFHRSFVIQQIPSSNLFMVVVDSSCLCESVAPITMAPIEIRYILFCVGPAASAATGKREMTGKKQGSCVEEEKVTSFTCVWRKVLKLL